MHCSWVAIIFLGLTVVHAAQVPLGLIHSQKYHLEDPEFEWAPSWDLEKAPSVNTTDNLMFDNAFSLLQRWPNTRWRNGHVIVPVTMAPGTLLYHGRTNSSIPITPEWIATDPEHSVLFCWTDCWLLTLAATRELRFLYFDGSSAAKGIFGTMDSQDLLAFGKVDNASWPGWGIERDRIATLCEWGKSYGIDGYVRMEMDFEIMLCSFTEGVKAVSMLNLQKPNFWTNETSIDTPSALQDVRSSPFGHPLLAEQADPAPPGQDPPERSPGRGGGKGPGGGHTDPNSSRARVWFEVVHAGSWHNANPGETRLKVDYAGLLSFYDTHAFPSLIEARNGKERIQHRIGGVAPAEIKDLRQRLEDIVTREKKGSGVDWKALTEVLVDRYADRLEFLSYILDPEQFSANDTYTRLNRAKSQLIVMLTPYFVVEAVPPSDAPASDTTWATPIFERCATTHTARLTELAFTREERALLSAVRGTAHEVCRRLVRMWIGAVSVEGLIGDECAQATLVESWSGEVTELMKWLDWSVWAKCRPSCGPEEICYLDTWPSIPRESEKWWNSEPKPRCVRKMEPYTGMTPEGQL